jgi:hypothetical protein
MAFRIRHWEQALPTERTDKTRKQKMKIAAQEQHGQGGRGSDNSKAKAIYVIGVMNNFNAWPFSVGPLFCYFCFVSPCFGSFLDARPGQSAW